MIPKIIHQIYFNLSEKNIEDFPVFSKSKKICQSYKNYQYILWNEEMAEKLIKDHYPEYYNFYNGFRYEIQKIDFIRLCIMHRFGGFYLDLDMYMLKDFENLRENKIVLHNIRRVKKNYAYVENDLMGSIPKSVFWLEAMKNCVSEYRKKSQMEIYNTWKGRFVLQTTGPYFLSRFVRKNYPNIKPMGNLVHTKWSNDNQNDYYVKDYKTNYWVSLQKKAVK